jgi:trimeric autotransporter adhesin
MKRSFEMALLRRALAIAVVLVATGTALAACSSNKSSGSSSTSTSTSVGGSTTTSGAQGGSSTTTNSSSSTNGALASMASSIKNAKHLTFSATYTESGSASSASGSLTYAQEPPKSLFKAGSGEIIDTGSTSYTCSSSSGSPTCVSFGSSNPLAGTLNFITGGTELQAINALESGIAQKEAHFSASFSTGTYAGQPAKCLSGTETDSSFKYCITDKGVLAYAGGDTTSGFGSLTLGSFQTSVDPDEFSLPPGATVVTLPGSTTTTS